MTLLFSQTAPANLTAYSKLVPESEMPIPNVDEDFIPPTVTIDRNDPKGVYEKAAEAYIKSRPDFQAMQADTYLREYYLDLQNAQKVIRKMKDYESKKQAIMDLQGKLTATELAKLADKLTGENYRSYVEGENVKEVIRLLKSDPELMIQALNRVLAMWAVAPGDELYPDFRLPVMHITNAAIFERSILSINLEEDEGMLMQIRGWLRYLIDTPSERIISATWNCAVCGYTEVSDTKPTYCEACRKETRFILDEESIVTEKYQDAGITEHYEDAKGTPTQLLIRFKKDMVNRFAPGDRVILLGILKKELVVKPQKKSSKEYRHVMEVIDAVKEGVADIAISPDEMAEIRKIASMPDPLSEIAQRFAPDIMGYEMVKKGIVLLAAGGCTRISESGKRRRGQINILLLGDPGTAKSQFLRQTNTLVQKALYVSDASGAGLTAAVTEVAGNRVMQAGVLVLASGGIAAIDELDKMTKEDRNTMHSAMEQGVVAKSKAGLFAQYKAETSIIAAANPKYGRFDPSTSLDDQIDLSATIRDRFDLIFLFQDIVTSSAEEERKALTIMRGSTKVNAQSKDFLLKYILEARKHTPQVPDRIMRRIAIYWAAIRSHGGSASIGTRNLESIVRLCEANAKLRMSDIVEDADFDSAKNVMDYFLKQWDFNLADVSTGISPTTKAVITWIKDLLARNNKKMRRSIIIENAKKENIKENDVTQALEKMKQYGDVYEPTIGEVVLI